MEEPLIVHAELKRQGLIEHPDDDRFIDGLARQGIDDVSFFPLGRFSPCCRRRLKRSRRP
jgi:hypothetical protein